MDEFFDDLIQHANHFIKTKAKLNPHSNPNVYQSNLENTICLTCSSKILTNNPHACRYYCKKKDIYTGLDIKNIMNEN